MKNIIYIHICCINNYRQVVNQLFYDIKQSGLYDIVQEIRCCILGNYDPELFIDKKIKIRSFCFLKSFLNQHFFVIV